MRQNTNSDPFEYMITKREIILNALAEESTLPGAWNVILKKVPEIENVIRFNTFKVYARILVKFGHMMDQKERELDKVRQESDLSEKTPEIQVQTGFISRFIKSGVVG